MPEGDTLFRTARTLRRVLAGREVTRFESVYPRLTRVDEDTPVAGRTVEDVRSAGKHLLIVLSGDLVLRSHLRMHGSWHVYGPGEPWKRPRASMRVLLETEHAVAVAFDVVDVTFHSERTLPRDSAVGSLGPDLLATDFDEAVALRNLRQPPDVAVAEALLNQWRLAGIGNVYKSETLFLCRIHPFLAVSALSDEHLLALVRKARLLMRANVVEGAAAGIVTYRSLRRTTRRDAPGARYWVYRRAGEPCRRCGTRIENRKMGEDARSTYFCPVCQRDATPPVFGLGT
ncbi:MAG: Fpg/Nei family DNA glycosylase [Vicinamibacterales bacterium]